MFPYTKTYKHPKDILEISERDIYGKIYDKALRHKIECYYFYLYHRH